MITIVRKSILLTIVSTMLTAPIHGMAGAAKESRPNLAFQLAQGAAQAAAKAAEEMSRVKSERARKVADLRADIAVLKTCTNGYIPDKERRELRYEGSYKYSHNAPDQALRTAEGELIEAQRAFSDLDDMAKEVAIPTVKKGFEAMIDVTQTAFKEEIQRPTIIGTAYVVSKNEAEASVQKNQAWINFLSDRTRLLQVAGAIALAAAGIYGAKEGSKLLANYLETILGKPKLVKESSVDSYWEQFKRTVLKQKPAQGKIDEVIVRLDLQKKLKNIALATKHAKKNNDPLMHVLFYGPPGVGKTMYAKELAKYAGMEYAIMSGADFSQFKDGDDITELHKIFDWAANSKKGLIVFVDEADSFLRNRGTASQKSINLTNAFLSRVEKQTASNIMFIFATNHPGVLDSAVLSRVAPGNRIEFVLPGHEERKNILNLYLKKYAQSKKITLDPSVEANKDNLATETNGLSGRDIEGAVVQMIRELRLRKTNVLTLDIVTDVLRATIEEKKKETNSFK